MLFSSILVGSLLYLFFSRRYFPEALIVDGTKERVLQFKDKYWPVEAGYTDHAWRHGQGNNTVDYGYPIIGKQEYANALPYAVNNEFNSVLNETGEGYAIEVGKNRDLLLEHGKGAIDIPGQRALITESFTLEEHARLDPTRQDITKGRQRRRQWSFVPDQS